MEQSKRPKLVAPVGQKFRIVVPQHIREELGINQGDTLLGVVEDGRWVMVTRAQAGKEMEDALTQQPDQAVVVGQKCRIVVPRHIREELGINEGDTLLSFVEDCRWIIMTEAQAKRNVAEAKRKLPGATSVVDLLIMERRWEFAKEEAEIAESSLRAAENVFG